MRRVGYRFAGFRQGHGPSAEGQPLHPGAPRRDDTPDDGCSSIDGPSWLTINNTYSVIGGSIFCGATPLTRDILVKLPPHWGLLTALGLMVTGAWIGGAEKEPPAVKPTEADRHFVQRVLPVLQTKCFACHGDDAQKLRGELDLRSRAAALKGGQSGDPSLVPGQPDRSPLYLAVTRKDPTLLMPPKENDRLTPEQVEWIRQWIAAGAPWPTGPTAEAAKDGVVVATSGGRSPEWTNRRYQLDDLWAYQPITKPAVPSGGHNPIDAFIRQKLQAKGLEPTPSADRRTLLRRAALDLTGLPPSPAEVEAFLRDDSADAYEKRLARLLESPHYGEQQARHWLDVARYADTSGFSNDFERPHAWRYRDYVIRSFNSDKPYDRFVREQLAGDEIDAKDPEMLLAGGFLRLGPWEHTGMTVAAVTRQHYLDDVTHHVGVTLLGQGLRCASCHDHKFDPVPTRDYYRLQAIFAPTQFAERPVPFLASENTAGFDAGRAVVEQRLKHLKAEQAALRRKGEEALTAFLKERGVASIEDLPARDRPKKDYLGPLVGLSQTDLTLRKVYQKSEAYLERELRRFEPTAFSVYSGVSNQYSSVRLLNPMPAKRDGAVPTVHILTGGSLESPADAVTPGVLSAMKWPADDTASQTMPEATDGRRLAFARWVVNPRNTLTARVIVNRVWQQHFGKGLVATSSNFGKMGSRPTHPELLDWLAAWFIENGWSLKKLHLLIMTSATYQQAGERPDLPQLRALDPRNDLLASFSPRRLAAEEIRDAMLAVTGELNREMGGPGVFPEINWDVAFQPRHIMGSVAPAYLPSLTPRERNRRTIYAFRYRTLADPLLEVFNRPGSETSCERRDETTVTPQAFALFNSQFVSNRALAFAVALERRGSTVAEQIETAFRLAYGRPPSVDERTACEAHRAEMLRHHRENPPKPTELPRTVRRHMVEELTGETVFWEEDLSALKTYQRDVMPWEVSAETRALAEVCLVLLNSNEFLYVR